MKSLQDHKRTLFKNCVKNYIKTKNILAPKYIMLYVKEIVCNSFHSLNCYNALKIQNCDGDGKALQNIDH